MTSSRLPLLALALLAVIPACSETRVRPGDTDTDAAPDTGDVDTDTDTDTDTTFRRGCLEGELDAGWAFETTDGTYSTSSLGSDQILLAARAGLYRLGVEDWKAGRPGIGADIIDRGTTVGISVLHSPLQVDGGGLPGFGGAVYPDGPEPILGVWTKWPGPNTDIDMADATIEVERLAPLDSDFADLNGDGLADAVPLGRAGLGVVYGPLSGTYTESDVELLPLPRAGLRLDWDDDGYVDYVGSDGDSGDLLVWLGPIVDIDAGTPPDLVLEDSPAPAETLGRPQQAHDIDGDGAREVWLNSPRSEYDELWSVNYPGTGVFRAADEVSVIVEHHHAVESPRSGDLDGDGSMDLVLQAQMDGASTTEVLVLPGPLGPGRYSTADGMTRVFPGHTASISMLGDVDGDGRDDFVVEGSYTDTEVERSLLYLGCPTW